MTPRSVHGVRSKKARPIKQYSVGEEVANSITHGIGAALGVAALVLLCVFSGLQVRTGLPLAGLKLTASVIYGVSMILEYSASTLYHALTNERAKAVFKVLDHAAIYLLIAGTYTPFCLVTLWQKSGMGLSNVGLGLLIFIWAFGLVGIACEAFWVFRPKWVSVVIYLAMGWAVVFSFRTVVANLAMPGVWLLIAGGLAYSIGTIFYVIKKVPYLHAVWHTWVLAGTVCHFLSVILYVIR
jgi:hemolysin III